MDFVDPHPVSAERQLKEQAGALGAAAHTAGREIELSPPRQAGSDLLGHELAHVVQQNQGRRPGQGS